MNSPFVILCAGVGSRVKSNWHKGLLRAGKQAILSHIIESLPLDQEIILILGYQSDLIREYCSLAHPDRYFRFVQVPDYSIGPGVSLMAAKPLLERPFIISCCDSVVELTLPEVEENWIAVSPTDNPEVYSTARIENGKVVDFQDKSSWGYDWAFTGLAHIQDYETFWAILQGGIETGDTGYVQVFKYLPNVRAIPVEWADTGTVESYQSFRESKNEHWILDKTIDEQTYLVNGRCIKLHLSAIENFSKTLSALRLKDFTPPLTQVTQHGYSYDWIEGETAYSINSVAGWVELFDWIEENLLGGIDMPGFRQESYRFYKDKTKERLAQLKVKSPVPLDQALLLNGRCCAPLTELVEEVDWHWVAEGEPSIWHGDLQPENIILNPEGGYTLIDWRSSFGGRLDGGDKYYDLAKMYAGLVISNRKALTEEIHLNIGKSGITFTPIGLTNPLKVYETWLMRHGYNLTRVKRLASLIHLSMAPLHQGALAHLLLFQGWRALDESLAEHA